MKLPLLIVLTIFGCNPGNPINQQEERGDAFSVSNPKKNEVTTVSISSNVVITHPAGTLTGVVKKEKRKYYDTSNFMKYAVKFSDDGFKLRDHNEQLLWKVKWYDDKIKVANNEEMTNAWEIKLRDEGKLKLERNERLLTELRLSEEDLTLDPYQVSGVGISLAPGLLLIDDLTELEKIILMAEVRAKNR